MFCYKPKFKPGDILQKDRYSDIYIVSKVYYSWKDNERRYLINVIAKPSYSIRTHVLIGAIVSCKKTDKVYHKIENDFSKITKEEVLCCPTCGSPPNILKE